MKKWWMIIGMMLLSVGSVAAQNATPGSTLRFDQPAPTVLEAQGYTYQKYVDGGDVASPLNSVTCSGAVSPFVCEAPFTAFTPGSHTIRITASNVAGESLRSTPFPFTFVVVPAQPLNLRLGVQ